MGVIQQTNRNKENKQHMKEQNGLDAVDEHIQGQQETHGRENMVEIQCTSRIKESKQHMEEQNSLDAMDEHIQGQQETHEGRTWS